MVIIVEGIDRVGKTTLCTKLSAATGYKIVKKEREQSEIRMAGVDARFIDACMNYGNAMGFVQLVNNGLADNFIFDRFHWTEAVYGLVDRSYVQSSNFMCKVEHCMEKHLNDWLIVYIRPQDIMRSEAEHGSSLEKHLVMYERLVNCTKLPTYIVEGYNDIDSSVYDIKKYIKERSKIK